MGMFLLRNIPVAVLVIIAALDRADIALLGASFPMLEKTLGVHVETLGYFSLFQNLSYALSIPFWAWLVHRYKVQNAHNILSMSCFLWGVATLSIARSETILYQAFFRCLNGGALASILPLSQMMLVDLVPTSMRGSAFGLMGLLERVAAMIATSAVVWTDDWRIPYSVVGAISMLMAFSAKRFLRMGTKVEDEKPKGEELTMIGIVKRVSREPSFVYLIAQGVFGAIPWNMMSFVVLLLKWKGFTKKQIISFQVSGGMLGSLGVFLGGVSGDYFSHLPRGRVGVALFSVISESLFYSLFLYSEKYHCCLIWKSLFHLTGGWATAAAIRPLCADLAQNQSERAQILAAWIFLDKTSSAMFGAPLVGYLTKKLFDDNIALTNQEKARLLARSMSFLSTLFWGVKLNTIERSGTQEANLLSLISYLQSGVN
ncbi:LOW QUALITY PROTEIN: hypothetical protein ACHAXA_011405 [Cyclostephanos tholiformis]|uniref:Major facilitator superfamily (MFS) profile domain-containing protein n=1 Tax=Cyclostephanos tholiformis TaxID=382380 RepID=A0ABD3R6X8_9STRA